MRTHHRAVAAVGGAALALVLGAGTSLASYRVGTAKLSANRPVTGLSGDTVLVGMDYRVQDGRLYAVGDAGGLYRLSTNGVAKKVKQLTVTLDGTRFGVDFNPVANALRIVSDTGQNLRQPFADLAAATVADLPLNYTAGVTASGIVAAAYTNNDYSDTTGTTLFDLDAALDQVVTQAPANNGSLQLTGKTGVDLSPDTGFDVFTSIAGGTRASGNTGYVTQPGPSSTTLSTVSLLTGDLTTVATIPVRATDIAVQLVPQVA